MTWRCHLFFFFQAEDGIRDLVRSRGLGDVYKRQLVCGQAAPLADVTVTALDVAGTAMLTGSGKADDLSLIHI